MINVVICTDEPILYHGLVHALEAYRADIEVTGNCSGVEELELRLSGAAANILVLDLAIAGGYGSMRAFMECAHAHQLPVVIWARTISTELALQAMSMGARAVLMKTLPIESLIRCLKRVHEGEIWLDKELTDSFMTARKSHLTRRQGQLVALLSQGLKNKEIAHAMDIAEGTVKIYLSHLFQKLGVKDRYELALWGLANFAGADLKAPDATQGCHLMQRPPQTLFHARTPTS